MALIDIHVHTSRYSPCSMMEPHELVAAARQKRLDGVIITEHDTLWGDSELEELRRSAGDLLILNGQEVRTRRDRARSGDVLVFGSSRRFPPEVSPERLLRAVHEDGGVVVAAHPYREGLGVGDQIYSLPLDGVETLSGNALGEENESAWKVARALGLPCLGGSDAHEVSRVGVYATHFEGRVAAIDDIIRLIAAGKCRPVWIER